MERRNGVEISGCQDPQEMILGLKQEVDEFNFDLDNDNLDIPEEEQIQIPAGKTDSHSKLPGIRSENSAFLPYKQQQPQSLTVLTNLQRGNVQTHTKNFLPEPLSFHQRLVSTEEPVQLELLLKDQQQTPIIQGHQRTTKEEVPEDEIDDSNIHTLDAHGLTPLMWTCFHGRLTVSQMLVEKGAAINFQSIGGESALMYAAANGHVEIVSFLLSRGAIVDLADENGNTALMYATLGNHPRCVTELLRQGASMLQTNELDESAFSMSVERSLHAAQNAMEQFLIEFLTTSS